MDDATTLYATLDRIEHDEYGRAYGVLVFDDRQQLTLPLERLPSGCREGSVLIVTLNIDAVETERRREAVRSLQARLFGSRAGDARDTDEEHDESTDDD